MPRIQTLQQRLSAAQAPISAPIAIPAPTKGWNTRDELDAMDPLDAVQLDNWFPDAGGVTIRNGFVSYATGMGASPVSTLTSLRAGSTNKFVAAASGQFWDISTPGTATSLATGFASDQWQTTNLLSKSFFVNGQDAPQIYDGTSFANASFTGPTLTTLYGVWQYQQRLFFWQRNSTGFYYALLNSISGALAFYDLAAFCPRGGNLVAMTTISYDGGNGVLDYAVFIMSSGDALVFSGNDPALSTNWSLVGQYRLSPPVSPRAIVDYGGDSFLTTYDDHTSLQEIFSALRVGNIPPRSKVSKAAQLAVQANKNAFGWQAIYYPRGRSLIFNIPNPDGTFNQHVCNTGLPSEPWCRYVNMNAFCWGLYNDLLYFGTAGGQVYLADYGSLDNLGAINAVGQQSWNRLGTSTRKRLTAVRPVLQSLSSLAYSFKVGFDYSDFNIQVPVVTAAAGSPWDTSPWDTSRWSPEFAVDQHWRVGGGSGTAIGFAISALATKDVIWYRTDLRMEGGNAL